MQARAPEGEAPVRRGGAEPRPVAAPGPLATLLDAVVAAAHTAARYIRVRADDLASIDWQPKAPSDFVSDVDTGAEARIRELLSAPPLDWPADTEVAFLGEESSPEVTAGGGITYVVDPLDGTTNFLHGYPEYAVSIAALVDGEPAAAAVINVPSGEVFTAVLGGGAYRNERQIRVSGITDPSRALIGTGLPFKHEEQIEPYVRQLPAILRATAGVRRAGAAALDLADVACGRFEAFWELSLAPWDVAAGLLLVREAGGVVTDLDGVDAAVAFGPVVAGNPVMHRWLLQTLGDEGRGTRDGRP